jgi:hypothetical protein
VDGDESKRACTDTAVEVASRRMLAAWVLQCTLEGDLSGLTYYAWFVLEDLAESRRFAGMPLTNYESA